MDTPTKNVAFYTLGCKLNFSETSSLAYNLFDRGFQKVNFGERADLYVINTCSVTDSADRKCRKIVRQALKQSPNAFITVIGCYAQLRPEEISKIPGVDLVLGAGEKFNLHQHLNRLEKHESTKQYNCDIKSVTTFFPSYSIGERTRSFLKVQDGCDYHCSYCTIPLARGKSRSSSISDIVLEAEKIALSGVREIVLTGVNIGEFGSGTDESFFDLIQKLDQIDDIERFRISSIEPNLLSNDIIRFVSNSAKFVPHFHIPLQSGSDRILRLMKRRYLRDLYAKKVSSIKSIMPDCCIGVDVIVGFPGETEEDFLETFNFINEMDISYLHVFTYSERPNTAALNIKLIVSKAERAKRSKILRNLSDKKRRHFYNQDIGKNLPVLFETHENGILSGMTENYIRVHTIESESLLNKIGDVKLVGCCDGYVWGELLN